jgi:hypothetical protein
VAECVIHLLKAEIERRGDGERKRERERARRRGAAG